MNKAMIIFGINDEKIQADLVKFKKSPGTMQLKELKRVQRFLVMFKFARDTYATAWQEANGAEGKLDMEADIEKVDWYVERANKFKKRAEKIR